MESQKMEVNDLKMQKLCNGIPKAELHIHIEGSFEPDQMFEIAKRNNIQIPYQSVDELKAKYKFNNLQEFLDIYYEACAVLINEQDFEELMYAYLKKADAQGVKYAEIFFDPQSHLPRGVSFATLINGFKKGMKRGLTDFGMDTRLIMCFLRHLSEEEAIKTFEEATPFLEDLISVGLDSSEVGHPPEKFQTVFNIAKEKGLKVCCHAGEEGDVENYLKKAVEVIKTDRIDHGYRIIDDLDYMEKLAEKKIPLTLCPLSNLKLKVVKDLKNYPIRLFLEKGLLVMLNSDDPAYFGGYCGDNYFQLCIILELTVDEIITLAKNSFKATFLPDEKKEYYLGLIDEFMKNL